MATKYETPHGSGRTQNWRHHLSGPQEPSAKHSQAQSASSWTTKASNSAQVEHILPSNLMSLETKESFKRWVTEQRAAFADNLSLLPPVFVDEGYTTNAFMSSSDGKVELSCGPAEYNVELFIHDKSKSKRLTLSDLLALPGVRDWLVENRPNYEGKQRIEGKVEYAFRLLNEAIGQVPEMNWLRRKANP